MKDAELLTMHSYLGQKGYLNGILEDNFMLLYIQLKASAQLRHIQVL